MTADEAFQLHSTMRQHGIPGAVTPASPEHPEGTWLVVDADGQDVTAHVLTRVAVARSRQSERGFIFTVGPDSGLSGP